MGRRSSRLSDCYGRLTGPERRRALAAISPTRIALQSKIYMSMSDRGSVSLRR